MTTETINTRFPGRPGYSGPTSGFFGLLHHDRLFEWSDNVNERIDYVNREKPKNEVATRLYNMIYIDLELPKLRETWSEYDKVRFTYDQAESEFYRARSKFVSATLKYIRGHIPDTAWDDAKKKMVFK